MPIPKTYDCLFDSDNLDEPIEVLATVEFVVWNGILPIDRIDHGHKMICVISFKKGIPVELNQLPNWDELKLGNYRYDRFGLCSRNDFALIIKQRKQKCE